MNAQPENGSLKSSTFLTTTLPPHRLLSDRIHEKQGQQKKKEPVDGELGAEGGEEGRLVLHLHLPLAQVGTESEPMAGLGKIKDREVVVTKKILGL